jgi:hypothetical protein
MKEVNQPMTLNTEKDKKTSFMLLKHPIEVEVFKHSPCDAAFVPEINYHNEET